MQFWGGKNPNIFWKWLILDFFSSEGGQVGGRASHWATIAPCPPLMPPLRGSLSNLPSCVVLLNSHTLLTISVTPCVVLHPSKCANPVAPLPNDGKNGYSKSQFVVTKSDRYKQLKHNIDSYVWGLHCRIYWEQQLQSDENFLLQMFEKFVLSRPGLTLNFIYL